MTDIDLPTASDFMWPVFVAHLKWTFSPDGGLWPFLILMLACLLLAIGFSMIIASTCACDGQLAHDPTTVDPEET